MKRLIAQLQVFSRDLDQLIANGKVLAEDFEDFERSLINHPKKGMVIPGLHGVRKTRLKSSTKGKKGGFRVDYLDIEETERLIFLVIYAKNEKSDLSQEEKKKLAKKVLQIKEDDRRMV